MDERDDTIYEVEANGTLKEFKRYNTSAVAKGQLARLCAKHPTRTFRQGQAARTSPDYGYYAANGDFG